ncbi:hypothetical protein Q0F99_12010 [Rathayibacter oskolensis]|uniref:hypothetical protein n=1 Tax=Rathayibacter TaxID=33886 RepID=UPI00141F9237|nr:MULTISPECIES: hypothetical protein [Rathayibacter]WKK70577.1 hypothetical protein Q0F99_12010 [Rathayibacter oskolensis]
MSDTSSTEPSDDDGLGTEGTIPDSEEGIALGVSGDSHFNPEEDPPAEDDQK